MIKVEGGCIEAYQAQHSVKMCFFYLFDLFFNQISHKERILIYNRWCRQSLMKE